MTQNSVTHSKNTQDKRTLDVNLQDLNKDSEKAVINPFRDVSLEKKIEEVKEIGSVKLQEPKTQLAEAQAVKSRDKTIQNAEVHEPNGTIDAGNTKQKPKRID